MNEDMSSAKLKIKKYAAGRQEVHYAVKMRSYIGAFGINPFPVYKSSGGCTDKKENQIFLVNKEIRSGAVAKSYMTNGLLIYGETFLHFLLY
jgi:hypothetical protein